MTRKSFSLVPSETTDLKTVSTSISEEEQKLQETIEKMKKASSAKAPKKKLTKSTFVLDEDTHNRYKMYLIQTGEKSMQTHIENLIRSLIDGHNPDKKDE